MTPLLFLPGYGNSGPRHWQSLWEAKLPGAARLDFGDWSAPVAEDWGRRLQTELLRRDRPCVLVAHSLACLVVADHVERHGAAGLAGAFLVAPPDPGAPSFPAAIVGFNRVPRTKFPVPSLVVSSADDPYADAAFGAACAATWGAQHLELPRAGHINADSGFGDWDDGFAHLLRFTHAVSAARRESNRLKP